MKSKIISKLHLTLFIPFLLSSNDSLAQIIEIGQTSKEVKQTVEMTTRDRLGFDNYGRSKGNNTGWDLKYNNGEISEVIQCFYKQPVGCNYLQ